MIFHSINGIAIISVLFAGLLAKFPTEPNGDNSVLVEAINPCRQWRDIHLHQWRQSSTMSYGVNDNVTIVGRYGISDCHKYDVSKITYRL